MALMAFELGLQPFEKREGVGGGAGEPRDHLAVAELADLAGVGLHHRLPHRDLAVTGDHDLAALAYRHDRRTVPRSEEHTSELQSLMRISYAVFCLTKKQYTGIG